MNDAEAMESMLRRYRPAADGETLRQRVLAARPERGGLYWEALAASVLVGLSLIQVIGSTAAERPIVRISPTGISPEAARGFSDDELSAARIAMAGSVSLRALPSLKGGTSWDRF